MTTLEEDNKRKAVLNEQVKLAATYLNGMAVAIFVVAGVGPLVAARSGGAKSDSLDFAFLTLILAGVVSVGVHVAAQALLRRIEP